VSDDLSARDQNAAILRAFERAIAPLPTRADKEKAVDWLYKAIDGDETERGIWANLIEGDAEIVAMEADGPRIRLTEKGMASALDLLHRSDFARAQLQRLSRPAVTTPPKDPQ